MQPSTILFSVFRFLLVPVILFTTYLYFYPAFHGCSFPPAKQAEAACYKDGSKGAPAELAPFRLLTLADPQIEGDNKLPKKGDPRFPSLIQLRYHLSPSNFSIADVPAEFKVALTDLITRDVPKFIYGHLKRVDLWGNDLYLAHVYRSVRWWSNPTHTVVLGDLLGSQWIKDEEFWRRSKRFWKIFKGQYRVPDHVSAMGELDEVQQMFLHGKVEALDEPGISRWRNWLINVAGNHDIGYAGDLNDKKLERFEQAFGKANWETRFQLSSNTTDPFTGHAMYSPKLRLVMLNSMNMDGGVWDTGIQEETHAFMKKEMERVLYSRKEDATILLTHIPLHKENGICTDGALFTFFPPENGAGIKEQNHLTDGSSDTILDGLFPMPHSVEGHPSRGIILNGHDHEGCDVYHYQLKPGEEPLREPPSMIGNWTTTQYWWAKRFVHGKEAHGIREVTVRSMMGSYGGNSGLLSAWFDSGAGHWKFEYQACIFGIQHFWWGVHIFDLIVMLIGLASLVSAVIEYRADQLATQSTGKEKKNQ